MTRPYRFFAFTTLWFLVIGPAFVLPIPFLLPYAYLLGGIPAITAGVAFAIRYRARQIPSQWLRRAWSGVQVGATMSVLACLVWFAVYERLSPIPIGFESSVGMAWLFAVFGALGGGLAATTMPNSLRNLG